MHTFLSVFSRRAAVWWLLLSALLALSGCSPLRFLGPEETLLASVRVESDSRAVRPADYRGYVHQEPNSRWFSLVKVPLGIYCLSGTDSTRRINRFVRKLGEAPVVFDASLAEYSVSSLRSALVGAGYLHARVTEEVEQKGRKTRMTYHLSPGPLYYVDSLSFEYDSPDVAQVLREARSPSLLFKGMPLDATQLEAERSRIVRELRNAGFYALHNEFVTFVADTLPGSLGVGLTLRLACPVGVDSAKAYRRYRYARVAVYDDFPQSQENLSLRQDSLAGILLFSGGQTRLRPRVIREHVALSRDSLYSERDVQNTYSSLNSLPLVNYVTLHTRQAGGDGSDSLDCDVQLHYNPSHNLSLELEGTNTAGDLGAALALTYTNRNLFRGAEQLSLQARGAYEAITGLEGYSGRNYVEYSLEASLRLPSLRFKGHKRRTELRGASEFTLLYDSQDRPEFHRRVLTGAFSYRWSRLADSRWRHRFDLFSLNYVFMPWISETFRRDYLETDDPRNAVLRYSYENLFVLKWGYSVTFNSARRGTFGAAQLYQSDAWQLRMGVEAAGNLPYAVSRIFSLPRDAEGQYTLFHIAYSQYVKFDFDFAKSFRLGDRSSFALHAALGVAQPYGNSTILPYETRYFSGGANSVRGWSVRELGPGAYQSPGGQVDFVNQTGNIKLDLSVEYRAHLFWKIDGAVFVDAGNVWTTRRYAGLEAGQFRFDSFARQIAVAYGLGLRLNFDYFILRFDGGMKAINPAYTDSRRHYPLIHPDFNRDFTFHFAVGLPF